MLFWLYFCVPKTKSTSYAQIKPEIFVNIRPEPDPKIPAWLATLSWQSINKFNSFTNMVTKIGIDALQI